MYPSEKQTSGTGLDASEHVHGGMGVDWGDTDNDGNLDVIVSDHDGTPLILRNQGVNAGHRLTLHLVGTRSNRDGIGARVTVEAGGKKQGRDLTNSGSFLSAHDPRLHFGLGSATQAEQVTIRWSSGKIEIYPYLTTDRIHILTEGKSP